MNYSINIDYTKNKEKTGNLTLIDENNKIILKKVPICIPDKWIQIQSESEQKSIQASLDVINIKPKTRYVNDFDYNLAINRMADLSLSFIIKSDIGYCFIRNPYAQNDKAHRNLNSTHDAFVLEEKDYKVLEKIYSSHGLIEKKTTINYRKSKFSWFQKNVNRNSYSVSILNILKGIQKIEK